ncbi:solute carrier family 35 member F3 isoform X2 [Bemisia tabaci]|uniref:solute carrier family 35 member F3 isoform X2 n=1 Tax=Bemisia tabaci TaxID=7038 RepID=UPI0008F9C768|nr:PREDICTED: putative thiamine transporter SLC35F3 isoform X2 [Bemisia tabaci]
MSRGVEGGGDIPTIFNPHRVRAPPNLVVTGTASNGPFSPALTHSDSVSGSQNKDSLPDESRRGGAGEKLKSCRNSCCSKSAKKIYFGVCVTVCVTASWVGSTHSFKYLYYIGNKTHHHYNPHSNFSSTHQSKLVHFDAPFFTTWFCTAWTTLFFPIYFIYQLTVNKCTSTPELIRESFQNFRDKGFTTARFLTRCSLFCMLWVGTSYMFVYSLRILLATEVMALFATNVSCVYLLSWVILHQQFVGVRIVAVILCDTGVALLAYMDGITDSPTLGGVVLAASSAAGSAVYKVLFKKVIGNASYGQIALFFSVIGLINAALLWPLCLALYFTGVEVIHWDQIPWPALLSASILSLVANLLGNFCVAVTYDLFITLGLITAVPVSAALDVVLYGADFKGMKLAGIILISIGFFLVMFPNNWPDYITRVLRWSRNRRNAQSAHTRTDIDYRTGYIRSHLRSPSGRVR